MVPSALQHHFDFAFSHDSGCASHMAAQPELGLLPKQRSWIGACRCHRPHAAGSLDNKH